VITNDHTSCHHSPIASVVLFVLILGKLRGPEREVVTNQLHDRRGVLVLIFGEVFDVGNGVVEGLLGHLTGFAWLVHDLVVEDGEVQSKTEPDRVGGLQILLSLLSGCLVGFFSLLGNLLELLALGVLTDVPVVVSLHLEEEHLALGGGGLRDQVGVDEAQDVIAEGVELGLDLFLVVSDQLGLVGVAGSLLDAGERPPGGPP